MRKSVFVVAAISLGFLGGAASAQQSVVTGAAGGAVTGAVVGGPVGAAIGGVTGAIVGGAVGAPKEVVTYVQQQPDPSSDVVVQQKVVVGEALPESVVVTPVPQNPKYAYAVVNHERVIVQPETRKVVQVIQ